MFPIIDYIEVYLLKCKDRLWWNDHHWTVQWCKSKFVQIVDSSQNVKTLGENDLIWGPGRRELELLTKTGNQDLISETLSKAQRTRGLSSVYQSNFLRSYHKFLHKSCSNFISRISTKHQLRNLNQISAFWLNFNFKILTKPGFRIST